MRLLIPALLIVLVIVAVLVFGTDRRYRAARDEVKTLRANAHAARERASIAEDALRDITRIDLSSPLSAREARDRADIALSDIANAITKAMSADDEDRHTGRVGAHKRYVGRL